MYNYEIYEYKDDKIIHTWYWNEYYSAMKCMQGLRMQERSYICKRNEDNKILETYNININVANTTKKDRSSQIAEDLKYFLYEEGYCENIKNEFGFQHDTNFVTWVGDGHSFVINDGVTGEYRVTITKEEL